MNVISMTDNRPVNNMLTLDRATGTLCSPRGFVFDAVARCWQSPAPSPLNDQCEKSAAQPVSLADAARWLQHESRAPLRVPVGVIGPRQANQEQIVAARQIGEGLAWRGYSVICGGREGVMEAVCKGIASQGGVAIGLLPDADPLLANSYVNVVIASGMGEARNAIIARAAFCLVAVGDSFGTLSEVALGRHFGKRVFGLAGASTLAGVEAHTEADAVLTEIDRLVFALPSIHAPER